MTTGKPTKTSWTRKYKKMFEKSKISRQEARNSSLPVTSPIYRNQLMENVVTIFFVKKIFFFSGRETFRGIGYSAPGWKMWNFLYKNLIFSTFSDFYASLVFNEKIGLIRKNFLNTKNRVLAVNIEFYSLAQMARYWISLILISDLCSSC